MKSIAKKILITILLSVSFLSAFSQAKKPIIMVIPSDGYCNQRGYTSTFTDETGQAISIADYKKAFINDSELKTVITHLSQIMADRGFPLKDLEQTLKSIDNTAALDNVNTRGGSIVRSPLDELLMTAKADIIMDIDFQIKSSGPRKYIAFNLRGVDPYTNKVITGVAGDGTPSHSATTGVLLEEAVLNYMDTFNATLQKHFDDLFLNGREASLVVNLTENSPVTFDDEFDYEGEVSTLSEIIEWWLSTNAVNGRFSTTIAGETRFKFEQVRTPLTRTSRGREIAADTRSFALELRRFLSEEPFNITSYVQAVGLGEAHLQIGE